MAPQFPVINEGTHATEFVLSEANGHRSRDNAYIADPSGNITVGTPLQLTAAPTTDKHATYVKATTGANCHALALYAGVSSSGYDLRISVLTRDAEVNLRLIDWGNMSVAEQAIGVTTLLGKGIVCRI